MTYYGYKVEIYPTKVQKGLINRTLGSNRKLWNAMLAERKTNYEKRKKGEPVLPNKTIKEWKQEFPFMNECAYQSLAWTELHLKQAFNDFFKHKKGFPKFKSKQMTESYTVAHPTVLRLDEERQRINILKLGEVKYRSKPRNPIGRIKNATISRDTVGRYYCSLLFEMEDQPEIPKVPIREDYVIGIDMSLGKLYVDSNGESPEYKRLYRKAEGKLNYLKRMKSKKKKGSRRYNKLKLSEARIHRKVRNQRRGFNLQTAQDLVKKHDAICIEDLNVKAMSQGLSIGKSVHDVAWRKFVEDLERCCSKRGKTLFKVGRFFPSSKTCSRCGTIKQDLRLEDRTYKCECGLVLDRDHNAAINLRKQGIAGMSLMLVEQGKDVGVETSRLCTWT